MFDKAGYLDGEGKEGECAPLRSVWSRWLGSGVQLQVRWKVTVYRIGNGRRATCCEYHAHHLRPHVVIAAAAALPSARSRYGRQRV